jgi:hypothetical protein
MIFYIPNKSTNNTNVKNFSSLNDGYSLRLKGSYNIEKPFGYLFRRNSSSETLIIEGGKLHFQYKFGDEYFSNILCEVGDSFDFFIRVNNRKEKFIYTDLNGEIEYDFKCDFQNVVKEDNYFTFLSDNVYEKTTDKNILNGNLDLVVIYDRLLEPHEISFNLKTKEVLQEDSLFSCLDTTEKTNFKIFDNSGNGNHAFISEPVKFKHDKIMDFVAKSRPNKYG